MRGLAAVLAAGAGVFALAGGALAIEDLEQGKSAAELFAKDCALCHKTPQAVVKDGAPGEGFLRQHYTSSRETAASLAAYLRGIKPPAERAAKPKSAAKRAGEKQKAGKDAKGADAKPAAAESKPADKPPESKPAEKPPESNAAEPKASEKKPEPADKKE